ncbi:hypothetical protein QR680_004173 [Steinernema hermaphroditum]|uniref:Uncharacterized protein n=1 Tax=Steinernema hermaphroditum TaxID=289476 RepID=A0AA39HNY1_9BILA|nr:hypothetical protein QR680_004173 [Steinernema hermaphroditum]
MHRQQVLYSFYAGPYVCIISRRGTKLKKFPKAIYNYATLNYPNLTESNDVLDIFGVEFDLSTVHFTYKPHSSLYGNMPVTDIFEKDKLLFGCETFTMVDAVEKQFPKECQYLDNNIQLKDLMNDFKVRLTNFHIYVSTVRTTTRDLSPPEIIYKEVVETFRPHGKKKPGNWKTYNSWIDIRSKVFSDLVVRDSSRTELHYSMSV